MTTRNHFTKIKWNVSSGHKIGYELHCNFLGTMYDIVILRILCYQDYGFNVTWRYILTSKISYFQTPLSVYWFSSSILLSELYWMNNTHFTECFHNTSWTETEELISFSSSVIMNVDDILQQ